MGDAEAGVAVRFASERRRLGLGVQEAADACGVTRNAIGKIERGAMPSGGVLQGFALKGADVSYVLTGQRQGIDLTLLGICEAALRSVYQARRGAAAPLGSFRPRVVGTLYNQIAHRLGPNDAPGDMAVAAAESYVESLDDPGDPELLARSLFHPESLKGKAEASTVVEVKSGGYRVAGRDYIEGKKP